MTFSKTLIATASVAALLAGPALALNIGATERGDTLGVTYDTAGSAGTLTATAKLDPNSTDNSDTLGFTTGVTGATAETTFNDKTALTPADMGYTLGINADEMKSAKMDMKSAFIGDQVVSSDDAPVGTVAEVWSMKDGQQVFVIETNESLGVSADRFVLKLNGNAESDGWIKFDLTKAEVVSSIDKQS